MNDARIGPNAIIQTVAALREAVGKPHAAILLAAATGRTFAEMPEHMVNEDEVIRFVHAIRESLAPAQAAAVMRESGVRTAEYLIANRIPRFAQRIMRVLPAGASLRILLGAIMKHTWTFAGSAAVRVTFGRVPLMTLQHCPMCRGLHSEGPCCVYYTATLERLMQRLVSPRATVREEVCEASGAPSCVFAFKV